LSVALGQLVSIQDPEMCEQFLDVANPLARGSGMAPRLPVLSPFHSQAIVCAKRDDSSSQDLWEPVVARPLWFAKYRPTNRAVTNVKCEVKIGGTLIDHDNFSCTASE
jgi:hypothetical protein